MSSSENVQFEVRAAFSNNHLTSVGADMKWTVALLKEEVKKSLGFDKCVQFVGEAGQLWHDEQLVAELHLAMGSILRAVLSLDASGRYYGVDPRNNDQAGLSLLPDGRAAFYGYCQGSTDTTSQGFTLFGTWTYSNGGGIEVRTNEREFRSLLVKPLMNAFGCRDPVSESAGNWGVSRSPCSKTLIFCWAADSKLICDIMSEVSLRKLAVWENAVTEEFCTRNGWSFMWAP
eukprot:gnl/MRDRNA2_/MRDRNA2_71635_c0_seq1.p1 gnl/MRDRNA2_/MRDRNA2_71635_c0~~gnl/MRDRNA2_/MRDRNA2_71635_c0_seq1.p1  ORF type:complete len:260 (+),score=35.46 gnl/MRDRNA2_/MRDRNA2_71635_c0_seq1:89-781(+)